VSFVEGPDSAVLAARLDALLPGVVISARPDGGVVRRYLRASSARMDDIAVLRVDLGGGEPPLALRIPDHPGLDLDRVATIVGATVEVRRAFGPHAAHIRELSFDLGEPGFRSNRIAGTADPNLGHIHLNAKLVAAGDRHRPLDLQALAAHECWHQIEHVFQLRRFSESIEFRRTLGEHFGVETLERAITGRQRGAPPDQRAACERLRTEVSDYATTKIGEATAEMMVSWWCSPEPQPPIAVLFGQLMRRYFDVQRA
jgi:hypothetical protein